MGQAVKQNRQQSAHWRGKDSEHVRANRPMKGPTGFLRLTHLHLSQHDLLHSGRVDERGHPAHRHVQVHARRGRHEGEWEGRSKAHAEGARVCHLLIYSLPIPLVTLTFFRHSVSRGFFVCGPYGSAADLQLELLEILTPGLGRAARR